MQMQVPGTVRSSKTPASLGFQMPAEWDKHESTWLSWPTNVETWPGKRLAKVEDTYLQMLEGLLPGEKVNLLVRDKLAAEKLQKRLGKMGMNTKNLVLYLIPTVDTWIRDYGPTFLKKQSLDHRPQTIDNKRQAPDSRPQTSDKKNAGVMDHGIVTMDASSKAWVKWIFNAWGGKYASLMEDTHVFSARGGSASGGQDKSLIPHPCFDSGIILEGGSIEVNGEGTCLTTEQCLLNKNRNPHLSRKQIEQLLKDYLGVSHIVWLKEGIVGDDTDGHIDDIARFVNKNTIVTVFEEDESDANYHLLKENWDDLKHSKDQDGKKWNVVKLPMPGVIADGDVRLPASYGNFLIANKAVLLPVYGHKNDRKAGQILQDYFPKHEILPIRCNDMVYGLGAIHCVSQQEPA